MDPLCWGLIPIVFTLGFLHFSLTNSNSPNTNASFLRPWNVGALVVPLTSAENGLLYILLPHVNLITGFGIKYVNIVNIVLYSY